MRNPKNVVIMVGDGMGYNQVAAGSLFLYGEVGKQGFEHFPVRFGVTTFSASGRGYSPDSAWVSFSYVQRHATDSGASATAISTGTKTYNGAIGFGPDQRPLDHLMDLAENVGKSTGVVSSVPLTHATPAGFLAHNASRAALERLAQEMILRSRVDVLMACGNPWFDDNGDSLAVAKTYKWLGGEQVWNGLLASATRFDLDSNGTAETVVGDADGDGIPDAWTLIQTRREFCSMISGPTPNRVIGIPQTHETLQNKRFGQRGPKMSDYREDAPYAVPQNERVPTLPEMTRAALNVLDNDPDGFVLMVEGGAIDWSGHSTNSGRMIEEMVDFTRAVDAVSAWVDSASSWDETLVVVTGDHETGYLWGPGSGLQADGSSVWNPLQGNGVGRLPGMQWNGGGHTNSLLPLYAKGRGSERFSRYVDGIDPRRGPFVDNTTIFKVLTDR
jgi:alkaline phosphatase